MTLVLGAVVACSADETASSDADLDETTDLTKYVDPFVGTDPGTSPLPPESSESTGNDYPGPSVPFGMLQLSPDTRSGTGTGYRYSDTSIQDFSLTRFAGAGCDNAQDVQILPITGALTASPGKAWTDYASPYTKRNEAAAVGYYKTRLDRYGTNVELTATTRTGMARLAYPATRDAKVLINASRTATGSRDGSVTVDGNLVTGHVTSGDFCNSGHTFPVYFAIEFDRMPTGFGTWKGRSVVEGSKTTDGSDTGAWVSFDTTSAQTVQFKTAISYVSVENARLNLEENVGWDFAGVRADAERSWNELLNRIRVRGGSEGDLAKFYTALYHVFQSPNTASDRNGQYMGFDKKVHVANGMTVYQNYSGWDIYRSWAALMALALPEVMTDIVRSMVLDGQQGGLLPKWSNQMVEDFVMTGDPGPIVVASAHAFGVRAFDTDAALALMEKASDGGRMQGNPIRGRQAELEGSGFVFGNASDSLEYAASDFAVAQFAKALGDRAKHDVHMRRAQTWINVFNPASGYIHTRFGNGFWDWPLDPSSHDNYTEGSAAQYTWTITYNFAALIDQIGGPATAVQRLDHHFTKVNDGHDTPYFWIGNEPEHGVPWAYNFARYPAGASSAVRRIMNEAFRTGPGGLPGNDDLGATSAWYVWAALGMYPAIPGSDVLALHGPTFDEVVIHRTAGDIRITSDDPNRQYVQGVTVNGARSTRSYVSYPELAAGGTIAYATSAVPDPVWGTAKADVPPSFSDGWTAEAPPSPQGTNLAEGKRATGSAPCSPSETADKAVDGRLKDNSKWCSREPNAFLQVDLGSAASVASIVVKQAGLGGETTSRNLADYTIATSLDAATWTDAVVVSENRASRAVHPIAPRSARYVRVNVRTPNDNGDAAARIYELEVYGGP